MKKMPYFMTTKIFISWCKKHIDFDTYNETYCIDTFDYIDLVVED
jgi:hypothetical protein